MFDGVVSVLKIVISGCGLIDSKHEEISVVSRYVALMMYIIISSEMSLIQGWFSTEFIATIGIKEIVYKLKSVLICTV